MDVPVAGADAGWLPGPVDPAAVEPPSPANRTIPRYIPAATSSATTARTVTTARAVRPRRRGGAADADRYGCAGDTGRCGGGGAVCTVAGRSGAAGAGRGAGCAGPDRAAAGAATTGSGTVSDSGRRGGCAGTCPLTQCRAPSATTSSGCSVTIGAMPNARCSALAASGIRLEPPTRNRPAMRSAGTPACRTRPAVVRTVRSTSGRAISSNSVRLSGTSASSSGGRSVIEDVRDSISLPARTSSQSSSRSRASAVVSGWDSRFHAAAGAVRRSQSTTAASTSRPPTSSSPSTATTSNPDPALRTTLASNVPAPKSYTTTAYPGATS